MLEVINRLLGTRIDCGCIIVITAWARGCQSVIYFVGATLSDIIFAKENNVALYPSSSRPLTLSFLDSYGTVNFFPRQKSTSHSIVCIR